jgi:flavin reductase (DIM6/NTAB) family NADH-FMN oxidoreductase RutF
MSAQLEIDPATTDARAVYRLLIGSVVPRPIGWASTVSASGVANLAPFSFFTVVCARPPMISLTIARRADGGEKDTLKNVRATGELCFNVATRPVWERMVDTGNGFPEGDSEFAETGLTPLASVKVKPPRVGEVPIHFECRLHQAIELGASRHTLVIGEVVLIHVDPACMTGKYVDMRKLDPVGRLNGYSYTALGEILERKYEDKR